MSADLGMEYVFDCAEGANLLSIFEQAREATDISKMHLCVATAYPAGIETTYLYPYALSSYFDEVQILLDELNYPVSLTVIFMLHPGVDRYWRDLMVNMISKVSKISGLSLKTCARF